MSHRFIVTVLIALAIQCSGPTQTAGGSSDSGNPRVVAVIYSRDGEPVADAVVRMRRTDYVTPLPTPAKAAGIIGGDARTDAQGRFSLSGIEPGEYRIEVGNDTSAVLFGCTIGASGTIDLGLDTLRPLAGISGVIDSLGAAGFVRVRGLERLVRIDSAGRFIIADLPEGAFDLNVASGNAGSPMMEVANVKAVSGDTTTVAADARWSHSRRLYINTTATGAGVSEDVTGFPLLVRLDGSNFDFLQARDAGQDVRFVKADGSELRFEIERWDRIAGQAEIWVRVDTIRGNNDRQFITMLWGGRDTTAIVARPVGAAVFDTANGFVGVWHLSEENPRTAGTLIYKDASVHAFNGADIITATRRDGMIGLGHEFDSTTRDHIDLGSQRDFLGNAPCATLEAWIQIKQASTSSSILSISTAGSAPTATTRAYILVSLGKFWAGGRSSDTEAERAVASDDPVITTDIWYHVVGVIDYERNSIRIFVNGTAINSGSPGFVNPRCDPGPSYAVVIGAKTDLSGSFFHGFMDEVRVQRVRRSDAWIRLCYENQKTGQTLMQMR